MFWPFLTLNPLLEFPSIILPPKGILGVGMKSDCREILGMRVPGDFPELNPLQDGFSLYKHGAHTTFSGLCARACAHVPRVCADNRYPWCGPQKAHKLPSAKQVSLPWVSGFPDGSVCSPSLLGPMKGNPSNSASLSKPGLPPQGNQSGNTYCRRV